MDADRKATLTGVAIALGGNVLISLALNVQKLAHKRLAARGSRPPVDERDGIAPSLGRRRSTPPVARRPPDETTFLISRNDSPSSKASSLRLKLDGSDVPSGEASYFTSPLWWSGLLVLSVGELCNFAAYGFAPASVVAPLGSAALVANFVSAPLILGERFRSQDTLGVSLAIIGASTIVLSARTTQPALDPAALVRAISQLLFIVYSSIAAALIVFLSILAESGHDSQHLLIDIALCAALGGFTVLSTKAVSSLFSSLVWRAFREPVFYGALGLLLVTALGQLRYLNRALQRFPSKRVVPAQFACFTLSVLLGSSVLYRDFDDVSPQRFMTFVLGLTTTLVGVALLAPEGGAAEEADTDSEEVADAVGAPAATLTTTGVDGERQTTAGSSADLPVPSSPSPSLVLARSIDRGRSPTSVTGRSPLLTTIRLDSPPPPAASRVSPQGRNVGSAGLANGGGGAGWMAASATTSQPQKPRLRRLSTASVRALSAGGILLSSSFGSTSVGQQVLERSTVVGGPSQGGAARVVPPPGQLASAAAQARPDLAV